MNSKWNIPLVHKFQPALESPGRPVKTQNCWAPPQDIEWAG